MSIAQDQPVESYDFETDILRRSPGLLEVKPHLGLVEDSPPPLVPYDPTPESSELEEEEDKARPPRRRKRRKGRTSKSQSDQVLIQYLAPDRPEISNHAGRHPLDSQSESDEESGSEDLDGPSTSGHSPMRSPQPLIQNVPPVVHLQSMAIAEAAPKRDDFPMVDRPWPISGGGRRIHTPPTTTISISEAHPPQKSSSCPKFEVGRRKEFDLKPPPLELDLLRSPRDSGREEEDSIVKSPALGRFTIKPQNADPDAITLPALHRSPPRSSPAGSPEYRQTLPSIRNLTIPHFNDSASVSLAGLSPMRTSPRMTETPISYLHSPHHGPGMSPPEQPLRYPGSWRSSTRDSSISTCSEYTSPPSVTTSTPGSSIHLTQSPAASYPNSLPPLPEQGPIKALSQDEQPVLQDSAMTMSDLTESQLMAGPFRCNFPGCLAIPFQTQYLLSSHMNVHSNQRPHFCPVKGCPRALGGQGFKRKNEMIRHGLVHTSPGYICPFCADQQHRYPRPDNLQRHVRVHHENIDRDDPLLRDVLNQRPEGGSSGRRRRMNS